MSQGGKPRVAVTAAGPSACWTLAFRAGGQIRVATIVKATFIFAPERAMVLVDPDPLVMADHRYSQAPHSSLLASSDLVPWRPRADVTLRGHAKSPQGQPISAMTVRLVVARGASPILDKRLVVQGPLGPSGPAGGPMPITSIPLVYELAAGGPASPENPVGVQDNSGRWPNILDAAGQPRPVGFGPISPAWPVRARLWHAPHTPHGAALPEFPADFHWEYFHAAPPDQRLDYLQGDEWVGFEGMNSQIPRVQSHLPRAHAAARVYGPDPEMRAGKPVQLVADTLSIDTDQLRCWVVWRGVFVLKSEAELDSVHVVAGVETPERPLAFPPAYESLAAAATGAAHAARAARDHAPAAEKDDTQSVPSGPQPAPARSGAPFDRAPGPARRKPDKRLVAMRAFTPDEIPPAPPPSAAKPAEDTLDPTSQVGAPSTPFPGVPPSARPRPKSAVTETLDLSKIEIPRGALSATPFAPAPPPAKPPPKGGLTGTFDLSQIEIPRASVLPFAAGAQAPPPPPDRPSSLPQATPFDRPAPATSEPAYRGSAPPPEPFRASATPPAPLRASATPPEPFRVAEPAPADPSMTLGAHFLAAMARASGGGRAHAAPSGLRPSYL